MKKSLFIRLFAGYIIILLLFSSMIMYFSFATIRSHYINTLSEELLRISKTSDWKIREYLISKDYSALDRFVKSLSIDIGTRITVILPNGKVIADSQKNPAEMENHRDRKEIFEALKGEEGQSLRFSRTLSETMLYIAIPIEENDNILSILRLSFFISDVNNLLFILKSKLLEIIISVFLVSLLVAYFFYRSFTKPIKELEYASQQVGKGNFNTRIFLNSKDELGNLARSFNYMVEQINILFKERDLERQRLETLISTIKEGIMVIDKEGKLTLFNESLKRISKNKISETSHYWDIFRDANFIQFIKKGIEYKEFHTQKMIIGEKVYLISINYVVNNDFYIIVLHDITQVENFERYKKDLAVNVSHELRTPLTSIKGFVETLLDDEDDEDKKHYMEIILRNSDRVINIVNDLLSLSEMEYSEYINYEDINIVELQDNLKRLFEQKIKTKNLQLEFEINEKICYILGDSFKIEQMLINLIDNAIKYTEAGKITMKVFAENEYNVIQIQDTGLGIPEKDLNRIFERFYVVDKSRSRQRGGTGLGLSIVKHIVLLHKGTIDVESQYNKGTTFIIKLPQKYKS